MKSVRLRELPDWPPEPGGAFDANTVFPMGGEGRVDEIFAVSNRQVTFHGQFRGQSHSYHYFAPSARIAESVHAAIAGNLGKSVFELGDLEIEIEEAKAQPA